MREEIFSKLKDYNNELEKILEDKDFSQSTKNLLLSMFYKIEMSYNDYATVKRRVKTKQEYLNEIVENIKKCKKIELVLPNTKLFDEFKNKNILHETDYFNKSIKAFANEMELLYSIFELNDFKIFLNEKYNLIRNSFPYLLNLANDMNNVEVLRDFNAWSWNTSTKDIIDIRVNLIYENIKLLLNFDIIETVKNDIQADDVIQYITQQMMQLYGQKNTDDFLNLVFKISIIIYIEKSKIERDRLRSEKKQLIEELEEIKDKKTYIDKITQEKKELIGKVRNIDITLNEKDLLMKEFKIRNENLSESKKIFSISNLEEKLRREKNKYLRNIDICNYNLQPINYIEKKKKLKRDFEIIKNIDFEENNTKQLYSLIYKLQILFIKLLYIKLSQTNQKQDLINLFYEVRYYAFLPYNSNTLIAEKDGVNTELAKLEDEIIRKMYSNKIINTLSTNEEADIKIVKNVFSLKTISLEQIYMELILKNQKYFLNIYEDKETPEKSIMIDDIKFNKKDKIRLNKKVKLFI